MRNLIFFDDDSRDYLLPLVYTRPVAELRVGILSIREKWTRMLRGQAAYLTADYLAEKYPFRIDQDNFIINGALLPNDTLAQMISQLDTNEALLHKGDLLAARMDEEQLTQLTEAQSPEEIKGYEIGDVSFQLVDRLWKIFQLNGTEIERDYALLTEGKISAELSSDNKGFGKQIYIDPTARVRAAVLNAETGPIYIGAHAEIMEGSLIRGPFAILDHSVVKMGAKIYGATTIGPHCKVGGEINNAVFQAYSNKAHDGFLGNAVIGEWCNLGADTNNSNLKNNYEEVKLWQYPTGGFEKTGTTFCGLFMGDHSKCGINTMFNTGTIAGVSANVFGAGYPRNFIPSFAWGGASGYQSFRIEKALETARAMMARRNIELDSIDEAILRNVYEQSATYRNWEK